MPRISPFATVILGSIVGQIVYKVAFMVGFYLAFTRGWWVYLPTALYR